MNRESKARLRAIRDGLREFANEIDEMVPVKEKKRADMMGPIPGVPDANVTFVGAGGGTPADETPKEGIYMKDLNEETDLKDMSIIGQITSIGDTETWHSERLKTSGFVKNWVLGDSSGEILVVFWDDQIEKVKDFMLGTNVKITDAWQVKKNRQGILELHPGKYFNIERVE